MKQKNNLSNKTMAFVIFWIGAFLVSRIWVLDHAPFHSIGENGSTEYVGYSDVKHDYERYANIWKYGMTPYLEHLYEYPPATIPLVAIPLEFDLLNIGEYYQNYRVQIFVLESLFFLLLLATLIKIPTTMLVKNISLAFYVICGIWAVDYWYEGIDLVFTMLLSAGIMSRYLLGQVGLVRKTFFWVLFWLSTAVKFMTLPLALPYFLTRKYEWKKEFIAMCLGFIIVWAMPLAIFRSSLSVSVVVHMARPLKYGSLGTFVVNSINDYTQTETQTEILPHKPIVGPVSSSVEIIVSIAFPLVMMGVILFESYFTWKKKDLEFEDKLFDYQWMIRLTLIFFFCLFLSTKVFSSPFHLWYVPLLAMFPYKFIKDQLILFFLGLLMLGLDTNSSLRVSESHNIWGVKMVRLRGLMRFLPMGYMIYKMTKIQSARAMKSG